MSDWVVWRLLGLAGLLLLGISGEPAAGSAQPAPGQRRPTANLAAGRVRVKPVVFVPKDLAPPNAEELNRLWRHVTWAQQNYRQMLGGRDTFALAGAVPE